MIAPSVHKGGANFANSMAAPRSRAPTAALFGARRYLARGSFTWNVNPETAAGSNFFWHSLIITGDESRRPIDLHGRCPSPKSAGKICYTARRRYRLRDALATSTSCDGTSNVRSSRARCGCSIVGRSAVTSPRKTPPGEGGAVMGIGRVMVS